MGYANGGMLCGYVKAQRSHGNKYYNTCASSVGVYKQCIGFLGSGAVLI